MREFHNGEGHIVHLPDTKQRERDDEYQCRCHERMGNDFYFLPMGSCLWNKCDNPKGQALDEQ